MPNKGEYKGQIPPEDFETPGAEKDPFAFGLVDQIKQYLRQHPEDPRSVDEVFIAGRIIVVDEAMKEANKEENKQEVIRLYEQLRQLHSEEREARSRREKLGQKFESKF